MTKYIKKNKLISILEKAMSVFLFNYPTHERITKDEAKEMIKSSQCQEVRVEAINGKKVITLMNCREIRGFKQFEFGF